MPVGRPPKQPDQRRNRAKLKYEWQDAPEHPGWQHGDVPEPPEGLLTESIEAWNAWFAAWWAAWWKPEDVPQLRQVIRRFDEVVRGKLELSKIMGELDAFGITPKGRTNLRWVEPKAEDLKPEQRGEVRRLQVVDAS